MLSGAHPALTALAELPRGPWPRADSASRGGSTVPLPPANAPPPHPQFPSLEPCGQVLSGRARPRSPSPVTAVPRARGKPRAGKAQPSPGPDLTRGRRAHRAAPQAAPSPGGAVSGPVPAAPASSRTCRGARRPAAGAAGQPVQTISQLSGLEARAAGGDASSAAVRARRTRRRAHLDRPGSRRLLPCGLEPATERAREPRPAQPPRDSPRPGGERRGTEA